MVLCKIASNVADDVSIVITKTSKSLMPRPFFKTSVIWPGFCRLAVITEFRIFLLPALLKQQGMGVKGATKSAPVNEEIPPLLEGGGKLEVILIKNILIFLAQMKLYHSICNII